MPLPFAVPKDYSHLWVFCDPAGKMRQVLSIDGEAEILMGSIGQDDPELQSAILDWLGLVMAQIRYDCEAAGSDLIL